MVKDLAEANTADELELDDLVKELDAALDAWFMAEVAPALEESYRARGLSATQTSAA